MSRSLAVAVIITLLHGLVTSELHDQEELNPENIKVTELSRNRRHFKPIHFERYRFGPFRRSLPYFGSHDEGSIFDLLPKFSFWPRYEYPHFIPPHKPHHSRHPTFEHHENHFDPHKLPYNPPHQRPPWERPNWYIPDSKVEDCDDDSSSSSSSSAEDDDPNPCWHNWHDTKNPCLTKEPKSTTRITALTSSTQPTEWITPSESTLENVTPASTRATETWDTKITSLPWTTVTINNWQNPSSLPTLATHQTTDTESSDKPVKTATTTVQTTVEASVDNTNDYKTTATPWDVSISSDKTDSTPQYSSTISASAPECIKSCFKMIRPDYAPICGTNNVPYQNLKLLSCVQDCGVDIELLCAFPCFTGNCYGSEIDATTALPSTGLDMEEFTSVYERTQECLKACPVTSEVNPVCGTDNITYDNPEKLICAQICGVDVKAKSLAACSANVDDRDMNSFNTTTALPVVTPSRFTLACIRGCQVTPEYNPVCGTNKVTYGNIGRLECAQLCGINVELDYQSVCKIADDNVKDEINNITSSTKQPINETEAETTDQNFTSPSTVDQTLLDFIFGTNPMATTTEYSFVNDTSDTTENSTSFSVDLRFNNV